jgi:hypothetical protein
MCNVSKAAQRAGYKIFSTDLIDRGFGAKGGVDFFRATADTIPPAQAIVSNPPYVELERFIDHALGLVPTVAVFTQLNFLSAFKRHKKFTEIWPLATVYVLSKRPSCLPGSLIMQGVAPGGGEINYCWLIFDGALDETALDRPALGFLMPPKGVFQVRRKPGARRTRDDDD